MLYKQFFNQNASNVLTRSGCSLALAKLAIFIVSTRVECPWFQKKQCVIFPTVDLFYYLSLKSWYDCRGVNLLQSTEEIIKYLQFDQENLKVWTEKSQF